MTVSYGEAALLLGKGKWVQHKISFHAIKTCTLLITQSGDRGGKVWPPWQTGIISLYLILPASHPPFVCVFPIFHFPASPCNTVSKCRALVTLKLPSGSVISIEITCSHLCVCSAQQVETQFKTATKSSQVVHWLKSESQFDLRS